jgi:hypothetical protein
MWLLVCVECLYAYCSTSNVLFIIQYTYCGWPFTKGLILLAKNNIVIVKFQSKVGWNLVGVAYWIENLQSIGMSCIVEINQPSSLASLQSGIEHHKAYPYFWAKIDSY